MRQQIDSTLLLLIPKVLNSESNSQPSGMLAGYEFVLLLIPKVLNSESNSQPTNLYLDGYTMLLLIPKVLNSESNSQLEHVDQNLRPGCC